MRRPVSYMPYLKGKLVPVLLVTLLATGSGCNLNQGKGEQMVNLDKISDDPEAQLRNLNTAISRNGQDPSLYARRAKFLLQRGELDKALADINESIKRDKSNMEYLFLKAQVLRSMGKVKEALPLALKAERNSYQSVSLYVLLSDLYLQLKQPQKAAIYTNKSLDYAPRNEYALYYQGRVAEVTGDTARAVANYKKALSEAPDLAEARRDLAGILINQRVYDEGRSEINKALKLAPKDGLLWFYNGQLYHSLQKGDSALWSYRNALKLDNTLEKAHYNTGLLLYQRGDMDGAISHFEKVAGFYQNNIKYIAMLANAYERTGQNIKALEQYQRLDALQPGYTFADQSIARLKAKLTRPMPVVHAETDTTSINE